MLLQPVFWRNLATTNERQRAKEIVEQYGRFSLAAFTLLNNKSYYFSPSGNSVIAYVPQGRGAIALGDPIVPVEDRRLEKILHYLYEHLNHFYNFKGLHTYKDKFHPHWEARYLVYPSLAALPDVVVALIRADSGDRLFDYFKPGAETK
ncbi:hypothetical protein A4S05_00495 [Nostoc sp. KVJ20]|nr:hypothetical protein A4S05_00495 [Nostoc sp. KVJ20]